MSSIGRDRALLVRCGWAVFLGVVALGIPPSRAEVPHTGSYTTRVQVDVPHSTAWSRKLSSSTTRRLQTALSGPVGDWKRRRISHAAAPEVLRLDTTPVMSSYWTGQSSFRACQDAQPAALTRLGSKAFSGSASILVPIDGHDGPQTARDMSMRRSHLRIPQARFGGPWTVWSTPIRTPSRTVMSVTARRSAISTRSAMPTAIRRGAFRCVDQ
jgi:hypothetical protein